MLSFGKNTGNDNDEHGAQGPDVEGKVLLGKFLSIMTYTSEFEPYQMR